MKPPICSLCHRRFDAGEGGLVSFRLTPEQVESNKRFEQPGFVGHPAGLHWFCGTHIGLAMEWKHLPDHEALAAMKIHFGLGAYE